LAYISATECVLAVQGRSRSSKVDDFRTNRERVMRLPICPPLWLWSYLAPFLEIRRLIG